MGRSISVVRVEVEARAPGCPRKRLSHAIKAVAIHRPDAPHQKLSAVGRASQTPRGSPFGRLCIMRKVVQGPRDQSESFRIHAESHSK
ncbi:hypothetical protein AVEN_257486-1 [Araneus ventricosus]|uniref:Uncharacterized protein n=1 Tax=Araneus ventricosus TaxID=182803 RepID=A0A4Y2LYY9_ARAVE|nr:hypothetical protein AVEN_257486-1 [Araneus ventricosus]